MSAEPEGEARSASPNRKTSPKRLQHRKSWSPHHRQRDAARLPDSEGCSPPSDSFDGEELVRGRKPSKRLMSPIRRDPASLSEQSLSLTVLPETDLPPGILASSAAPASLSAPAPANLSASALPSSTSTWTSPRPVRLRSPTRRRERTAQSGESVEPKMLAPKDRTASVFLSPLIRGTTLEQKVKDKIIRSRLEAAQPAEQAQSTPAESASKRVAKLMKNVIKRRETGAPAATNAAPTAATVPAGGVLNKADLSNDELSQLLQLVPEIQLPEMLFLESVSPAVYSLLPKLSLEAMSQADAKPLGDFFGPHGATTRVASEPAYFAAGSLSTYPRTPGAGGQLGPERQGDPICDKFCARLFGTRQVLCLTDGCGWGERPMRAAERAARRFVDYVSDRIDKIKDVVHAGDLLVRAIGSAHAAIVDADRTAPTWEVGTTTLFGCVVLKLQHSQYVVVSVSIGDCGAFLYRPAAGGSVTPLCKAAAISNDRRDPGGALGPVNPDGTPDLRNLSLSFELCAAGDLLLIMSDGVHDNLSPETRQLPTADFGLPQPDWAANPVPDVAAVVDDYARKELLRLIAAADVSSPASVVAALLDFAQDITHAARSALEQPSERTATAPGKMDHSTCLCLRIGELTRLHAPDADSERSKSPKGRSLLGSRSSHASGTSSSSNNSPLLAALRDSLESSVRALCEHVSNVPMSVSVGCTDDAVFLLCRSVRGELSIASSETSVTLKVAPLPVPAALIGDRKIAWLGRHEVDAPIERTVVLPCAIVPATQTVESDPCGVVLISFAKKPPTPPTLVLL